MTRLHIDNGRPPSVGLDPAGATGQDDDNPRLKVLISSVPSDSHTWNLVALRLLMEEMGHEVVNPGSCVPVELLLTACRDERPGCVVINTINGHGWIDGGRIITALRADPRLAGLTVVIGGKLGVRGDADTGLGDDLLALGFDAVFPVDAGDSTDAVDSFSEFVGSRAGRTR